jgi:hypothetical protein
VIFFVRALKLAFVETGTFLTSRQIIEPLSDCQVIRDDTVNLNSVGILLLVTISARRTAWSPVSDVGGEMMGLITVSFSALLKLQILVAQYTNMLHH